MTLVFAEDGTQTQFVQGEELTRSRCPHTRLDFTGHIYTLILTTFSQITGFHSLSIFMQRLAEETTEESPITQCSCLLSYRLNDSEH